MALMDHKTTRVDIPLPNDNSFSVRGLDVDDMTIIMTKHLPAMAEAAELFKAHQESAFSNMNFVAFCGTLSTKFPGLAMEVISIAADEPEAKNVKIGLGPQIAALQAILKLTIEEAGGSGNLFGTVAAAFQGAQESMMARSRNQKIKSTASIGA